MLPFVSIVTPTYNRRRFIPSLIKMVQQQTYPRDRLEWVVYDDGQEPVGDLLETAKDSLPILNYIFSDEKMTIGEKRNRLNKEAKGDILIAMDDDALDLIFITMQQMVQWHGQNAMRIRTHTMNSSPLQKKNRF